MYTYMHGVALLSLCVLQVLLERALLVTVHDAGFVHVETVVAISFSHFLSVSLPPSPPSLSVCVCTLCSWIASRNPLHLVPCVTCCGLTLWKTLAQRSPLKKTTATTLSGDAPTITGSVHVYMHVHVHVCVYVYYYTLCVCRSYSVWVGGGMFCFHYCHTTVLGPDVQLVTTIGSIQCVYRCTACMMHVQCMCVVTMYIYTYCTVCFF